MDAAREGPKGHHNLPAISTPHRTERQPSGVEFATFAIEDLPETSGTDSPVTDRTITQAAVTAPGATARETAHKWARMKILGRVLGVIIGIPLVLTVVPVAFIVHVGLMDVMVLLRLLAAPAKAILPPAVSNACAWLIISPLNTLAYLFEKTVSIVWVDLLFKDEGKEGIEAMTAFRQAFAHSRFRWEESSETLDDATDKEKLNLIVAFRNLVGHADTPPPAADTFGSKSHNLAIISDAHHQLMTADAASTPAPSLPETETVGSVSDNLIVDDVMSQGLLVRHTTHQEIETFLTQVAPSALSKWNYLCRLHQKMSEGNTPFSFLEATFVKNEIQEIQRIIQEAFNQANAYDRFTPLADYLNPMMAELQESGDRLKVFNTIVTIADAPPDKEMIMRAMGAIVASAFSLDSLQKRLDAGRNPFAEPLQLGVMMKRLPPS